MKWAKGDLVVTANYKSTFRLMSLLLYWAMQLAKYKHVNLCSAPVTSYCDCSFCYLHSPRPLTTVTEKSCLSVSHKWIQTAFVRLFYGFPNCWHNPGSLLPLIKERISAAIQPASLPPQAVDINHKAGNSHSSLRWCFCQVQDARGTEVTTT